MRLLQVGQAGEDETLARLVSMGAFDGEGLLVVVSGDVAEPDEIYAGASLVIKGAVDEQRLRVER